MKGGNSCLSSSNLPIGQVIQGDCLSVLKRFPPQSVDNVIIDIPYNVGKDYGNDSDRQTKDDYNKFLYDRFEIIEKVLKPNAHVLVFTSIKYIDETMRILDCFFSRVWILCWIAVNKRSRSTIGYNLWQPILLYAKGKSSYIGKQDTYFYTTGQEFYNHPTPKPQALLEHLLKDFTKEGDIILDAFLGSGTTAVACEKLRRKWIGIEINPEYCAIARKRLEPWMNQMRLDSL